MPIKCALLMKYMAKDLTYYDTDVENTNALHTFGIEAYKKLYPDFPPPILDQLYLLALNGILNLSIHFPVKVSSKSNFISNVLYKNPYKEFYANKFYGGNNWCKRQ